MLALRQLKDMQVLRYTLIVSNCELLKKCPLSPTKEHRWSQMCNWKRLLPWGPRWWQKQFKSKSMMVLHISPFWVNESSSNGANKNASELFQAHGLTVLCAMLNSVWSLAFGIADLTHGQAAYNQGRFVAVQIDFSRFPRFQHVPRCGHCREVQTKTSDAKIGWTVEDMKAVRLCKLCTACTYKNGPSNCLEISGTSNGFADSSRSHWLLLADVTKALAQVGLKPNTKENLQSEKLCLCGCMWVFYGHKHFDTLNSCNAMKEAG